MGVYLINYINSTKIGEAKKDTISLFVRKVFTL